MTPPRARTNHETRGQLRAQKRRSWLIVPVSKREQIEQGALRDGGSLRPGATPKKRGRKKTR